ncbi:hypothetical protein C8F04DRAFT_1297007 [Mycena alexandri]|uniref:DUF1264-domain-containing protein n=1 Tax=Mycena alexandri TaxID=1745969 RepID=A0AAD6XB20_9AGAR|nr:hypothetical protein C8F04DRAFT_1297007 [Mycena alexandri]
MTTAHPSSVETPGDPLSAKSTILETGAALVQDFQPLKQVCAHLNAFHVYASDPHRFVETNHYCAHLTEDVRQCILYDGPGPNARLIGVEYMITPKLYEGLPREERQLWHSHVFEVKSGMLIMPGPQILSSAWEAVETKEMEDVITLYGKTYHLWQTDRGDALPMGKPELMISFTGDGQFDFERHVGERDARFEVDYREKQKAREGIKIPTIHPDADGASIGAS